MDFIDRVCGVLQEAINCLRGVQMMDAKLDRIARAAGLDLEIPEQPEGDLTDEVRAYIIAQRVLYTEEAWLSPKGPRDQTCVRFGVSRAQVAGVLAGTSRRTNGSSNGHASASDNGHQAAAFSPAPAAAQPAVEVQVVEVPATPVPPPPPSMPAITHDPSTWPTRPGASNTIMEEVQHEVDETDREIAQAVLGAGLWHQLRHSIMRKRILTPQQAAGLKAALSRQKKSS